MTVSITKRSSGYEVGEDVFCYPIVMVNICLVGKRDQASWVLVDAGLWNSAERIREKAAELFGKHTSPEAIILTHGHFDHVGAVVELAQGWDVTVYAHKREIPYLTGEKDYPPPDSSVDDGLLAKLSPLYPNESINLGDRVKPLPEDGSVPAMPGWRFIHTPGHTPGHISLFRDADKVLIAGDAFTTVEQESALAVITQDKEVHGPPKYFTTDWDEAWHSVKLLEDLQPSVAITGHGIPLSQPRLSQELKVLVEEFDYIAIPEQGRYVPEPPHL